MSRRSLQSAAALVSPVFHRDRLGAVLINTRFDDDRERGVTREGHAGLSGNLPNDCGDPVRERVERSTECLTWTHKHQGNQRVKSSGDDFDRHDRTEGPLAG